MRSLSRGALGVAIITGAVALSPGAAFAALDDQGNPIVADDGMAVITADDSVPGEILPGLDGVDPAVQSGVVLDADAQPDPVTAPVEAVEPRPVGAPVDDDGAGVAPLIAVGALVAVVGAGGVVLVRRRQQAATPA